MSVQTTPRDDLSLIFSRIQVGAFMAIVGGLLLLTLASTFGEEAMRTIVLGLLTAVFVIGGGLFGLVTMHHISHTHLPETSADDELADISLSSTDLPVHGQTRARARGFLGMFALSQDASPRDDNNPDQYRRTA